METMKAWNHGSMLYRIDIMLYQKHTAYAALQMLQFIDLGKTSNNGFDYDRLGFWNFGVIAKNS